MQLLLGPQEPGAGGHTARGEDTEPQGPLHLRGHRGSELSHPVGTRAPFLAARQWFQRVSSILRLGTERLLNTKHLQDTQRHRPDAQSPLAPDRRF